LERYATDDIVRAIDVRLRVFDAGRVLNDARKLVVGDLDLADERGSTIIELII